MRQNGLMDIKPYQQHPSVTSPAPPHQYHLNDHHQVHRHNQQQQQQQYSPSDAGQLVYPRYDPSYGRIVRPVNGGTVESPSTPPHPAQYSALHRDTPPGRAGVNSSQSPAEDLIRFPPPYRNPPQPFSSAGSKLCHSLQSMLPHSSCGKSRLLSHESLSALFEIHEMCGQ